MIEKLKRYIKNNPRLKPVVYFCWIFVCRWGDDECPVKAAAMAFFGLLSVFPIILATVSILATVMAGNEEILNVFGEFVAQFFPGQAGNNISQAVQMAVYRIASGPNAASLGVVALASLLWSGRAYFATLAAVLNRIWPQATPRTFLQQQLVLWGMFAAAGILGLLSMFSTLALAAMRPFVSALPLWFLNRLLLINIVSHVLSWSFAFLMFWLLYLFLPNVQARQRKLILGAALFATIAWELAKYIFGNVAGRVIHYEATYGGIAGVVVTLVWIYVASTILLLGAEGAAAWEGMQKRLRRDNTHSINNNKVEKSAVTLG